MSFTVEVSVVPRSSKQRCVWEKDRLKCYLNSPPEKGRANNELIELFAKALRLPKSAITIVAGEQSRKKRVRIDGDVDLDLLLGKLGIERQLTIGASS